MIRPRKVGKRGFKIDKEATENRAFEHPRSFVSKDGHDLLFGVDKGKRRKEIYDRARGRCELQRSPECRGYANWDSFGLEGWSHECQPPHRNHCDCLAAGRWSCDPCHRMITPQVQWTKKEQAAKDFNALYPKEKQ